MGEMSAFRRFIPNGSASLILDMFGLPFVPGMLLLLLLQILHPDIRLDKPGALRSLRQDLSDCGSGNVESALHPVVPTLDGVANRRAAFSRVRLGVLSGAVLFLLFQVAISMPHSQHLNW